MAELAKHLVSAQGKLSEALAAYQQGLAIAKRLADQDTSNADWQRDLSAGYEKVADVPVKQDKLQEALDAYQQSLKIRRTLAAQDKSNAGWQRDLIVAYLRIGICVAQMEWKGNLDQANNFLHMGLDLARSYTGSDQQDLIIALNKVLDRINR